MTQSYRTRIIQIVRRERIVRPRDLEAKGIPREHLLRLMRQGIVHRTGRGVYELADLSPTEHHSLAVVAKETPNAVICLLSALRFHDLTTQHPAEVWVGIHVRARRPKISTVRFRAVRYSETTFKSGVGIHRVEGVPVKVFSVAKTVADCFKYRRKIGLDVAIEALREALGGRKATVAEVTRQAQKSRVWRMMRPYLEALA
ncbi:MAG: transcriptional regulator [Acidobacteria bacterium]|nr:transcriptional regulator [Acidobacteriota bacterium]